MKKEDIKWVCAFEKNSDAFKQDAINYWRKHKVLLREEVMRQRANQLVMMAYDDESKVIAASTGLKTQVKLLSNNWLYQYRCFIDPAHRTIGFDVHLTLASLDALEIAAHNDKDKPIGVFVVVENKNLYSSKIHNAAVWRAYKMYFIGYNTKGQPIRVCYFKDAKI